MPKSKTLENLLGEEEIGKILRYLEREGSFLEEFCFKVLLYTGMRVSEFVHMRKSWVDFNRNLIIIPEKQSCKCKECRKKGYIWRPKTKDAVRNIPIVPEIRGLLRAFFNRFNSVMDLFEGKTPPRVLVYNILRELGENVGLKHRLFPHALRGTFATILASKGFGEWEIKSALGWRSIDVATMYIKISGRRLLKAFEEKW